MKLEALNRLSEEEVAAAFLKCCGSSVFVKKMGLARPFGNREELLAVADNIWESCTATDGLEAFRDRKSVV